MTNPSKPDGHHLLRNIVEDFEALASLIERNTEVLAAEDLDGADIERLERANQAARRGATIARNQLPPS